MKKFVIAFALLITPLLGGAQELGYDFGLTISKGKVMPHIGKTYFRINHEDFAQIPILNLAHNYAAGATLSFSEGEGGEGDQAVVGLFVRAEWNTTDRTFVYVGWGYNQPWTSVVNGVTWDDLRRHSALIIGGGTRF